jgi:hypothetical protein
MSFGSRAYLAREFFFGNTGVEDPIAGLLRMNLKDDDRDFRA